MKQISPSDCVKQAQEHSEGNRRALETGIDAENAILEAGLDTEDAVLALEDLALNAVKGHRSCENTRRYVK